MKAGWEVKRLEELSLVASGGTPLKSTASFWNGEIPWYSSGELNGNKTTDPKEKITIAGLNGSSAKLFPAGSLLIGMYDTAAMKMAILDREAAFNQAVAGIKSSPSFDTRFVMSSLEAIKPAILEQRRGTRQKNLNLQKIKDIEILLPPLEEQQRIVAILDEAFEGLDRARANAEANLQNARELFESVLFDLYEVKLAKSSRSILADVCDLISGQHIDAADYNMDGNGIGYLTGPSDFGTINPIVTKWTNKPKRTAREGDILITVKGSGVGSVNIMTHDELAISRQLMAIRPKGITLGYLFGFIRMQQSYFQELSNGAAIPGISRSDVLDLKIPVPSPDVQLKYVNYLAEFEISFDALQNRYKAKLQDLDDLRQSLLQKALAGELS